MSWLYLGVDLGGTRMRAALGDGAGAILRRYETLTERQDGAPSLADQIGALCERVMAGDAARVGRVAVAAPGPLDAHAGVLFHPVNLTSEDVPLKDLLERRLGKPVEVQNDANVAALGEWLYGGHGRPDHMLYITVSTGVGAGIIAAGRLYDGFNTTAGEIGHTVIDPNGPLCGCGNRGCVEAICSGSSIARAARSALAEGEPSLMLELAEGRVEGVIAETVVEAARRGDELASKIFFRAADCLGVAVVNAIHLLSPEIVLIGGGVSQAGELLFGPVRQRVARYAMPLTARGVKILPAGLGLDAGLVGALALASLGPSNAKDDSLIAERT